MLVTIRDFNFDAMWNGQLWYDLNIKVTHDRKLLSESTVKDSANVEGSALVGAKYSMEREIPNYYGQIIRGLIRANPGTMGALQKPEGSAKPYIQP